VARGLTVRARKTVNNFYRKIRELFCVVLPQIAGASPSGLEVEGVSASRRPEAIGSVMRLLLVIGVGASCAHIF